MGNSHYREYENHLLLDTEEAPGGILVYYADGDEEIIHVNQYIIDLFECDSVVEFLDLVNNSFKGFVHAEDINAAEDSIWGQVDVCDNFDHIYYRIKTKTGRLINIEDFGRLIETDGERPIFNVFIVELTEAGAVDWLTGLPNMSRFISLSELGFETIRKRDEVPALVALDFIGLKSYNTQYGRDVGDKLLRVFSDILRRYFGSEASSRFGEDHFYAFASKDGLSEKLELLFADLRAEREVIPLPVRAGVYVCESGDDNALMAIDRAKIACDSDRMTWKSHIVWFNDEMRKDEHLRIHVLENIDQAIEKGWIRPHYQAIVRSATSDLCGEEALARWVDPEYGILSPAQFIPVLEESGLLHKVDLYMVDCVIADMIEKRKEHVRVVPVSVNISHRDLVMFDIAEEVAKRVDKAGIERDLIRIEFTESAITHNPVVFKRQLESLHNAGFIVWMDDFGSGYSSLNTLQEFDFDLIKLDMGLVSNTDSPRTQVVITGVVQMAKSLGMGVLAEGVETEDQAEFLESAGCGLLQGYLFSAPRPLENVIDRFKEHLAIRRENLDEAEYWDAIGKLNLGALANKGTWGSQTTSTAELPTGVLENRDGEWYVLRANRAYREFLISVGFLKSDSSKLLANKMQGDVDEEFLIATDKCLQTGDWVEIRSYLEYGTGLHYSVKLVAQARSANAFVVASTPAFLGAGLGIYGDVPVAYAVFHVIFNEDKTKVIDTEYIYANDRYCDWGGVISNQIVGRSFLSVYPNASTAWFDYCYRAVALGEDVHDVIYSPETGRWLSFNLIASPVEGACIYAFSEVNECYKAIENTADSVH